MLPAAVGSAHLVAFASIVLSDLPFFTLVICSMLVALSGGLFFRHFFYPDPGEDIKGLSWFPDRKQIVLVTATGDRVEVDELRQRSFMPGVIVLKLVPAGRLLPVWLILTCDQLDPDEWRRLAVMVRWAPPPQRDASGQG